MIIFNKNQKVNKIRNSCEISAVLDPGPQPCPRRAGQSRFYESGAIAATPAPERGPLSGAPGGASVTWLLREAPGGPEQAVPAPSCENDTILTCPAVSQSWSLTGRPSTETTAEMTVGGGGPLSPFAKDPAHPRSKSFGSCSGSPGEVHEDSPNTRRPERWSAAPSGSDSSPRTPEPFDGTPAGPAPSSSLGKSIFPSH